MLEDLPQVTQQASWIDLLIQCSSSSNFQGVISNRVGKPTCPEHSKSWFLGIFWMHKQDEVDVLSSSICGKDLEELVTSKLYTECGLRFFQEPGRTPQFTKCMLERSQIDQSDPGGKWTLWHAGTLDLYLPVLAMLRTHTQVPSLGQCAP